MTRQYVGARYVPKLMGEWNSSLSYEALSIVTYMGNSFTSKKPVPSGVNINNTEYWVNTANYSEQLVHINEELLNKVDKGTIVYDSNDIGLSVEKTGSENSSALNTFLYNHKNEAVIVKFRQGIYAFNEGITVYPKHCFEGYNTSDATILLFNSSINTSAFKISGEAIDNEYAYSYMHTSFKNIQIECSGNTQTRNGIDFGYENTDDLLNTPNLYFENVIVKGFKFGIVCEGYGHTFINVNAAQCIEGICLLHPEQTSLFNCWCQYCEIGLSTNNNTYKTSHKYAFYGHNLHIIGGSYQRNEIGIKLWNTEEAYISTYFELNNNEDILCGDPEDEGNYTKGCKNVKFEYNYTSTGRLTGYYSIRTIATVSAVINGTTDETTSNYLSANGYCKYFFVYTTPEKTQNINATGNVLATLMTFNNFVTDYGELGDYRVVRKTKGCNERVGFAEQRYGFNYLLNNGGFSVSSSDLNSRVLFNMNGKEYAFTSDALQSKGNIVIRNGSLLYLKNSDETQDIGLQFDGDLKAYFSNAWHKVSMTDANNNVIIKTPTGNESCELQFDGTNLKVYVNGSWKTLAYAQ